MRKSEEAVQKFMTGLNCSQSVLATYATDKFKDNTDALRLAAPFGSGIAYQGETCGAVTGALMVIGLHFGYTKGDEVDKRELIRAISEEFVEVFKKQHGSIQCKKLLGADVTKPEELKQAREQKLFHTVCPKYISSASEILEGLVDKYKDLNN